MQINGYPPFQFVRRAGSGINKKTCVSEECVTSLCRYYLENLGTFWWVYWFTRKVISKALGSKMAK